MKKTYLLFFILSLFAVFFSLPSFNFGISYALSQPGGPCKQSSDCANPDTSGRDQTCSGGTHTCFEQSCNGNVGDTCGGKNNISCCSPNSCVNNQCTAPPTVQTCTGQSGCKNDQYCANRNGGGDCTPGLNTDCTCVPKTNNGPCMSDSDCTTNYCANRNGGGECTSGLNGTDCVCSQKQSSGVCTPGGNQCGNGTYCASSNGGDCSVSLGSNTACTCKAQLPEKNNCTADDQCITNFCSNQNGGECSPGLTGSNCTCTKKAGKNGACTSDSQCSTNYCANRNGGGECSLGTGSTDCVCAPKPTTGSCTTDSQCADGTYCGKPGGGECGALDSNCSCIQNGTTIAPSAAPSLPPPPSPPCDTWDTTNNTCASFLTDFGSIATDPAQFIIKIFAIFLSLSGGIALLLIIRASYRITTSVGNPEAIKQGREELIAAIVGLLFLIFSFVILEVIGVDVLKIPDLIGSGSTTGTNNGNGGSSGGGSSGGGGGGTNIDATACDGLLTNPDCGIANGSGLFCGQNSACGITGQLGTLYKCTKNGKSYITTVYSRCPNQDCIANTGANIPDQCGTGTIKHYACQPNGTCQEQANGPYTTGNCNNACLP